jgi:hypothetical protein
MLQAFSKDCSVATVPLNGTKALSPQKQIQIQVFARMKAIDAERAVITSNAGQNSLTLHRGHE